MTCVIIKCQNFDVEIIYHFLKTIIEHIGLVGTNNDYNFTPY